MKIERKTKKILVHILIPFPILVNYDGEQVKVN